MSHDRPPSLLPTATTEDVVDFLDIHVPPHEAKQRILDVAKELALTGDELLKMTENDLQLKLGVSAFGARRKLAQSIKIAATELIVVDDGPDVTTTTHPKPQASKAFVLDEAAVKQIEAETKCIEACQQVAKQLEHCLNGKNTQGWASKSLCSIRMGDLKRLGEKLVPPQCTVVVVGNTGAGKSTLLNALLGEEQVLPTNGMRACTAVLVELQYDATTDPKQKYRGEIEFMGQDEWEGELEDLLGDLTQQDGHAILSEPAPNAFNFTSWCKLFAVYGEDFTHSRYATGEQRNGRAVYKSLKVEELKTKLLGIKTITCNLGKTITINANEPNAFRRKLNKFVDSSNEVSAGSHWPIVKRVRLYSKWDVLRSGTVLVDAPGVNDDNSSRDKIVKSYLKSADSVWIVSNINRAVNDKTAKDMLDASFRQQLLMDGAYGSLVFVATQSDVIQRAEVVHSLNLPSGTNLRESALARNAYTKDRILSDFYEGLQEMSITAGEAPPPREELETRYSLPIFCVSSLDFQKLAGIRQLDGQAKVWESVDETQIPTLMQHMNKATIEARQRLVRARVEALLQFGLSLISFTRPGDELPQELREEAEAAFGELAESLPDSLRSKVDSVRKTLKEHFDTQIAPKLMVGSDLAKDKAVATAQAWSSLHWATYKACCRRKGIWRIDMNKDLASPILSTISTSWERVFVTELRRALSLVTANIREELCQFHEQLTGAFMRIGVPRDRVSGLLDLMRESAAAKVMSAMTGISDSVQAQQKELSRSIEPAVQAAMDSAYVGADSERGIGSHARRLVLMNSHVEAKKSTMFKGAVSPVVESLVDVQDKVVKTLKRSVEELVQEARLNYAFVWEKADTSTLNARAVMQPMLTTATAHAQEALKDLLKSQGLSDQQVDGIVGAKVAIVSRASAPKPLPQLPKIKMEPTRTTETSTTSSTTDPVASSSSVVENGANNAAEEDEVEVTDKPNAQPSAPPTAQTNATVAPTDEDLELVSVVGTTALDFPHARFNCVQFSFDQANQSKFCERCYCYVCDTLASECTQWTSHCAATSTLRHWRDMRLKAKQAKNAKK